MRIFRQLECSPVFFIGAAVLLLCLPLQWCMALVIAAGFHEACHLLALRVCGCPVQQIRFDTGGAVIEAASLSTGKALLCTLAGPIGQLLLLLAAGRFPRLALCAAIQSAYNLLPLQGLDGGHALWYIFESFFPHSVAATLCRLITWLVLLFICLLGFYATFFLHLGLIPILAAGSLLLKATNGKIPCKKGPLRVQ